WLIACKTRIGYGAPTKEGKASSHGSPLGTEEIKGARENIGWTHGPFEIPEAVLNAWRAAGSRGSVERRAWDARFAKVDAHQRETLAHPAGAVKGALADAIRSMKQAAAAETSEKATRVWSELTLEKLTAACPALIGGS